MNTALIVAAGVSRRFGGSGPKQFEPLAGKPLILHTIGRFAGCQAVDEIILVLSREGRDTFLSLEDDYSPKLKEIVLGGATRAESVRLGLDATDCSGDDVVIVHDGARPLVTTDEIGATIRMASATGAACLVGEVNDTVKEVADGFITGTLDRRRLRRALTPQAFRCDILKRAFDGVELTAEITDECCLVERLGIPIAVVAGSSRNIKITRREDLAFAEALLNEEAV